MSERPERIEREMFEIRSRMEPDVQDLRQHVNPKVVGEQVKSNARQRAQASWARVKTGLKNVQEELVGSAKRQARLAGEAGRERNPSALTDAVKSDPRPLALLAILITVTLFMVRKVSNGREG